MSRTFRQIALILLVFVAIPATAQADDDARTAWRLLDYVAVDYAAAVQDGKVVNPAEYAEMVEFSQSVHDRLVALPQTAARPGLVRQAGALKAAVGRMAGPDEVASLARGLADDLLASYPMPVAPASAPDMTRAAGLYQQHCASCHGVAGGGDGPAAAGMDPPPIAFSDPDRARERSVLALYQVIEQGLEGTAMQSYAALPESDRWALAFHVGQFAYPEPLAAEGERLWKQDETLHVQIPNLETLTQLTPAALAAEDGDAQARAITAYLRRHPDAVQSAPAGSLALTRARLAKSLEAYRAGDDKAARDAALSAYLDGFEPVEPVLAARDSKLMTQIEGAMGKLRSLIADGAPADTVAAQVGELDGLFGEAEAALDPARSTRAAAFVGAFTILVREGVEALLVLIAIVAFLRKAGRTEVMPYVHAGWAGALLAGILTWGAATWLISISGASRELTEGFAALFAAAVLLFVGIWMHGKSKAGAWQRYIKEKLSHALSKRSMWFLFLLSFVVVYREVFETVLFFAALWSQGQAAAVVAGAGVGALTLAAITWAMLRYSRRLPIGKFFALSTALIAVLAVVLAGKGIAALQEAGWLDISLISFPRVALLGIYPTAQTVLAQLLVIAVLVVGFWYNARAARAPTRSS
ncbi:MAG TPA: FTR1 family protein [Rhodanobacteraceae bacterium]|nr:FTR1 family protein [Rhodanobacteraceae bacterium]